MRGCWCFFALLMLVSALGIAGAAEERSGTYEELARQGYRDSATGPGDGGGGKYEEFASAGRALEATGPEFRTQPEFTAALAEFRKTAEGRECDRTAQFRHPVSGWNRRGKRRGRPPENGFGKRRRRETHRAVLSRRDVRRWRRRSAGSRGGAKWYRLAADQGFARAQNTLGVAYGLGEGSSGDLEKAANYYRLAAEQGHSLAQCNLGLAYENGEGVEQDFEKAVKYYRLAAGAGESAGAVLSRRDVRQRPGRTAGFCGGGEVLSSCGGSGICGCQYNLAVSYDMGEGVEENDVEAVKYYRLAAEQGDSLAQRNLGLAYESGEGVEQDLRKR